ncbi:hypothetical protein QTN25_002197 [Entamoeba marina]
MYDLDRSIFQDAPENEEENYDDDEEYNEVVDQEELVEEDDEANVNEVDVAESETKQNENFGSQLGYFQNDPDDYSFSESLDDERVDGRVSYYGGNDSLEDGCDPHNESGNIANFLKGYKFCFGHNTKLFNEYEKVIKVFSGKAFKGYPLFLDGILPTFENDGKWHLTKPQYENTFYVVDKKDSKLIVAYFLCIFSQIPVITNKFLKELKDAETKENKTDNSFCDPFKFLAPVIPPEFGVYPELKQPFVFKPHIVELEKKKFKFIHLIGGRVVDNRIQNSSAFASPDGIDKTIYRFVNEGDTNKRLVGELPKKKVYRLGDVTITWEWVKCMIIKQCYIQPFEYLIHRSP